MALELIDRIGGVLTDEEFSRLAAGRSKPPSAPLTPVPPTIVRGVRKLVVGMRHEYSTMYPGDVKHRGILIQHPGGAFGLHSEADGALNQMLPAQINHSSQPRWRRKNADRLVFLYLNEIREFDAGTGAITTLRKFKELPNVNGMGESDLSFDDNHIVLCSGQYVFVYQFSSDRVILEATAPASFNNLYLTADNQILVGFYDRGHAVWDAAKQTFRVLAPKLGHMDTGMDAAGNPIMVWMNAADDTGVGRSAATPNCANGIERIDTVTGKRSCMLPLPENKWELAVHISCPDKGDFAMVSTFTASGASTSKWGDQVLKVKLDGSGAEMLVRHGSKAIDYERQPHAAISQDGREYVYNVDGDTYIGIL